MTRAVFIGSSNATDSLTSWPSKLSAINGWVMHNYAIGGSGYYTQPVDMRFRQQVANAVAGMSPLERFETSHFFVADASNDARSNTPASLIKSEAATVYSLIAANFPNAKIVVLPVIWPADTQKYTPAQWAFDPEWNVSAVAGAHAQKTALEVYPNAHFIDDSWTWLTGRDDLMIAAQNVHPNGAGHTVIANYVNRSLHGEKVTGAAPMLRVQPTSAWVHGASNWGKPLSVVREGWNIHIEGAVQSTAAFTGSSYMAVVPYGYRPVGLIPIFANWQGDRTPAKVELYPNGTLQIVGSGVKGSGVYMVASYRIG